MISYDFLYTEKYIVHTGKQLPLFGTDYEGNRKGVRAPKYRLCMYIPSYNEILTRNRLFLYQFIASYINFNAIYFKTLIFFSLIWDLGGSRQHQNDAIQLTKLLGTRQTHSDNFFFWHFCPTMRLLKDFFSRKITF